MSVQKDVGGREERSVTRGEDNVVRGSNKEKKGGRNEKSIFIVGMKMCRSRVKGIIGYL
jgi:hypothetical protein